MGGGALAVACSSSSNSPGNDNGDAGNDAAATDDGGDGAAACTTPSISVATIDGGTVWGCLETKCATSMQACACDPICNGAILGALECAQEAGTSNGETQCLTTAITSNTSDPPALALGSCLSTMSTMCGGPNPEAGTNDAGDAGHSDAGDSGSTSDAGDSGSTPDASDSGSASDDASDSGSTPDATDSGTADAGADADAG